jgi:putative intracellular protease/amidase
MSAISTFSSSLHQSPSGHHEEKAVIDDSSNKSEQERSPRNNISRRDALMLGGATAAAAVLGSSLPSYSGAAGTGPGASGGQPFEILFTIYPKGTLLDFAGPNEVFTKLPNTKVRFASPEGGLVTLENGVVFGQTERIADVARTDLLCVPGGPDLSAMRTSEMLGHVRRLAEGAKYVTSICTGSLILGASGVLKGKRSACHWACVNLLKEYGAIPDPARIVKDGRFISGGGVTSGIDFALAVAAEISGPLTAQFAQLLIEYNPEPPFRSGHPKVASREVLEMVEKELPGATKGLWRIG